MWLNPVILASTENATVLGDTRKRSLWPTNATMIDQKYSNNLRFPVSAYTG